VRFSGGAQRVAQFTQIDSIWKRFLQVISGGCDTGIDGRCVDSTD
jgi:hypothetical protein